MNEVITNNYNVNESQIPALIQSQFKQVSKLKKEISKATNEAFLTKEEVVASIGKAGGGTKGAISTLQNATIDLANAQVVAIKAQTKSFEYQQKLADITKYLFGLGVSNIAMNRVVVSELEAKLRNASENEIDDLARNEIENLLHQLKEQQDFEYKHNELVAIVKEHEQKIEELTNLVKKQQEIIDKLQERL